MLGCTFLRFHEGSVWLLRTLLDDHPHISSVLRWWGCLLPHVRISVFLSQAPNIYRNHFCRFKSMWCIRPFQHYTAMLAPPSWITQGQPYQSSNVPVATESLPLRTMVPYESSNYITHLYYIYYIIYYITTHPTRVLNSVFFQEACFWAFNSHRCVCNWLSAFV